MGGTKESVKTTTDKNDSGTGNSGGVTAGSSSVTSSGAGKGSAKTKVNDSVYTAQELAYNAKALFGVVPECVTAALRMAGIKSCTVNEAKTIVKNFLNQEVE